MTNEIIIEQDEELSPISKGMYRLWADRRNKVPLHLRVCARCGGGPHERDHGHITKFRQELLCCDCLMRATDMPEGRKVRHVPIEKKIERLEGIMVIGKAEEVEK